MGKIRMLFRELWSLRAPLWTSCLRYWGDLLWITLCTKIHLLYRGCRGCSFKGNGPYEMCPRPVSTGQATQITLTARLCTDKKIFFMYITAAIPYIRDINNSGHNVRMKKPYYKLHCYKSVSGLRASTHFQP